MIVFLDGNVLWLRCESGSCWDFTSLPFITLSFRKPVDS